MNLSVRGSARLRNDFVMRLGCILLSVSVVASLIVTPPKAKAVAASSAAASALAGAYLEACGLSPAVSGMGSSQDVNESLARLVHDYLGTIGSPTTEEWLGQKIGLSVSGGKVFLPKPVAGKLGEFAAWVGSKFVTPDTSGTAGKRHHVVSERYSYAMKDGTSVKYHHVPYSAEESAPRGPVFPEGYTPILEVTQLPMEFDSGFTITGDFTYNTAEDREYVVFVLTSPNGNTFQSGTRIPFGCLSTTIRCFLCAYRLDDSVVPSLAWVYYFSLVDKTEVSSVCSTIAVNRFTDTAQRDSLALDVTDHWQDALDRIASLEEQQTIALDVGATDSMAIQEILQNILEAILAGTLTSTAEVVDTADVPKEPEEPEEPVLPVVPSGLDRLGAALTSRFPFSIPWDVYKGVKLLAAPAKAPYFEADLLAPIAHRVGGWRGSTMIVLDFSEYEIIGQVCRWASTVGFCLMLASATKRLIWTA